ncbi:MAG TPA: ASKHA domain-containing protein [Candidatus Atribacteria bacterium]|nr:ASKHA domain-containing protein [Candidatus Atribacteria bacterium]
MNRYKVTILPDDVLLLVTEGTFLKEVFIRSGIDFEFPCGGMGLCKRCKVKIIKGDGKKEDAFACQLKVESDLMVEISSREERHTILTEGVERRVVVDPLVRKVYLELPLPSLKDNRDDWARLVGKEGIKPDLPVIQDLPEKLRKSNFKVTAVVGDHKIISVEGGDTSNKLLGMAFDIGTTTVVGYLINLKTGEEITKVSSLNSQTKFGADVISRITFASDTPLGLDKLHREIINKLNNLIGEAVNTTGYEAENIYTIVVVGNTTMHHLFLKIQPGYLARSPYVPAVTEPMVVDASDINLRINLAGKVFTFPNVAGFVGGDLVADALASEMDKAKKLKLLVDIGTNGEIMLGKEGKYLACSAAAGPAFEGAQISCGMRGASGAIAYVSMDEGDCKYTVIGETLPRGITGSGLVDIIAELLKIGMVNKKGSMLESDNIKSELGKEYKDRIISIDGILAFVVAENTATGQPVYINQKDIREFQLAKGAIAAGIEILLKTYGAKVEDIDEVFLAGAFGNYLRPESACRVGLIPQELEGRIKGIGNAAGIGAKLAMLSKEEYERAIVLSRKTHYIELSSHPEFERTFLNKLDF